MQKKDCILDKTVLHGKCAIYIKELYKRWGMRGFAINIEKTSMGVTAPADSMWNPNVLTFESPAAARAFLEANKPRFHNCYYSYHIVDCPDEAWVLRLNEPIEHLFNPDYKLSYLANLTKWVATFDTLRKAMLIPTHKKALNILKQYNAHKDFPSDVQLLKINQNQYYGLEPIA